MGVRFYLDPNASPEMCRTLLSATASEWSRAERVGSKPSVLGEYVTGVEVHPDTRLRGTHAVQFAEFRSDVTVDGTEGEELVSRAQSLLSELVRRYAAALALRHFAPFERAVIWHGYCMWPCDVDGRIGEILQADAA